MRSFSKKLAFVLAAAMVVTAFAPAAKAEAAKEMAINKQGKILYVTDGNGINDAAQVGGGKGNVSSYDFAVSNKPANWKNDYTFAWSSSDEDVITVKDGGLTTAVGVGEADVVCVVTEKATGKATTLKNTVTVKANAADVVITNADDYANTAVEVGDVVDLNRAMYDANGTKAPKRGVVVTDYTRWMAEPSTGVEINQKNGTYKFTDAAVAGEYKLWCETYQSSKYQAATATSDVVKVELVKEMTFDVVQNSTTKFTVYFNTPVKALTVKDVQVIRNLETAAGSYPYPQTLKKVELAKDKLSATVEIFQTMQHETNYTVKVTGFDDYVLTASNGKPVRMELKAKDMNPGIIVYTNKATEIQYTLFDAKDVQVALADGENVRLTLDRAASSKEVSFSGDKLTIRKNTASATVTATYQGYKENGKLVGSFSTSEVFFAEDEPEIVPVNVHRYGLDTAGWTDWNLKSFQMQNNPKLHVQIADSKNGNDWGTDYINGISFAKNSNGGKNKIVFEAMNPEICVINNAGVLTGIKPGVATFYVKYVYVDNNKKEQSYPFDEVTVEVLANSYVDYVTISAGSKTVGTAEGYNTADLFVLGRDQYNNRTDISGASAVSIKTLTEFEDSVKTSLANVLKSNTSTQAQYWNDGSGKNAAKITVKAVDLRAILVSAEEMSTVADDGECISIDFEATYDAGWAGKKVVEFTVTIQEPSGSNDDNVIEIVASDAHKDVMRKWSSWDNNAKAEKTVNFKVNWMNNDVQVGVQSLAKFDSKAVSDGAYQVKVLKNGVDVTNNAFVEVAGNTVTIKPSYIKAASTRVAKVVSGGAVSYDVLGEGVYTLELYKWTAEGDTFVETLEGNADISISVGNAGAYTTDLENLRFSKVAISAAATGDQYNKTDAEKILKCFLIKNTDGNNIVNQWSGAIENMGDGKLYFVDYTAVEGTNTVYVKEIVFYEPVATGEYVAYTVAIDKALEWDK